MKPIRFSKRALEQCEERGTSAEEVTLAIEHGSREPAKHGRELCRFNLAFDGVWQGRHYAIKQVAPVIKEELNEIVVITVYSFFF